MTTNDTSEPGAGLRAWQRAKTLRHDPDRIEKIGSDAAGIIEAALVREAEMLAIVAERDDLADTLLETTAEVRDVEQRGLALVAAAFEACVQRMREFPIDPGLPPQYQAPWNDLRALTPADAKATLDAMLTKAREGGRAERLEPEPQAGGLGMTRDEVIARYNESLAQARAEGATEEREACAIVAETFYADTARAHLAAPVVGDYQTMGAAEMIATRIRARAR